MECHCFDGLTYPNGKSVERSYDASGRLKSLSDWLSNTTTFSYDPESELTTTTFPEATGNLDRYAYDASGQMSEVKMTHGSETLASLSYARDPAGQLTGSLSKGLPGGESSEYAYDENERLSRSGTLAYEYDAANNPTVVPGSGFTYDAASELISSTNVTYSYDELGERTQTTPASGPATGYSYDQGGNLSAVSRPEEGSTPKIEDSYSYNGDGLRTSQTISGATGYLTWDFSAGLALLLDDGTSSYIYGPGGLPVEQIDDSTGAVQYLHHDQAGSTRLITSSTGAAEGAYTYTPYGGLEAHTGTGTTTLGYDGQYTSSDTGLIYLRARTYDPATAQFLSVDPALPITRAPYAYAEDNPLNRSDPLGLLSLNPISDLEEAAKVVTPVVHEVASIVATGAALCALTGSETVVVGVACGTVAAAAGAVTAATGAVLYAEGQECGETAALEVVSAGLGGLANQAEQQGLEGLARVLNGASLGTGLYGEAGGGSK